MQKVEFDPQTDVYLPALAEQFWLHCEIRTLLDHFDHPYIRLFYLKMNLVNEFVGKLDERKFLVLAETFMTDEEPNIGTCQVLELEYASAVGQPRLKSLTVRSALEWLRPGSPTRKSVLANEVREAIQAKLAEFIQA
jgi:hypothetical protein